MTDDQTTDSGSGSLAPGGSSKTWWFAAAIGGAALIIAVFVAMRSSPAGPATTAPEATGAQASEPAQARSPSAPAEVLDRLLTSAQEREAAGERSRAVAILRDGVRTYPGDRELRLAFAELLARDGNPEGAYEQLSSAIELGVTDAETQLAAGVMAAQAGRDDLAIEHLFAARTAEPENAEVALRLGIAQLRQGQLDEAQASLVLAGTIEPDRALVWGTLAEVALRANQPSLSAQHAKRARELDPDRLAWRLIGARALKRDTRPEEALDLLVGLPNEDRFRPEVIRLIGECLGMLGRPGEAAALYAEASERDPASVELAREAAIWIDRVGDPEGARIFAERAAAMGDEVAQDMLERLGG
ncbi:MAG: tetratricopeptide repeat protein [Planctomycetota bacterium]